MQRRPRVARSKATTEPIVELVTDVRHAQSRDASRACWEPAPPEDAGCQRHRVRDERSS